MAFKSLGARAKAPSDPAKLFRELPRRKFPDVLPHQSTMMQKYADEAVDKKDVALQLPTGSGKTLVGLLIAEWRRRTFNEKIVYLCPTKQLVNQVVEQAETKYGLSVIGFTGNKKDYNPSDVAKYNQRMNVAVVTYSSIFNINPFFKDADIIIVDDAHAAENYVSKLWSLEVELLNPEHKSLHNAMSKLVKSYLDPTSFSRLTGQWDSSSAADRVWVDKLPTPIFNKIKNDLISLLDEYTEGNNLKYSWSMLRSHLSACHLYLSSKSILIRPLLPPTWAHNSFSDAKQRIYMSATLGEGGDLERLVGRKNIHRLPTPEGWDTQGVGRRFFIFPSLTLSIQECERFNNELFKKSDRSLVLVPNSKSCNKVIENISTKLSSKIFRAEDIEESKQDFINHPKAIAVIANRYDGIDFPGDECRLLVIEGLPKTVNSQEQFLMSRIGANVLFNERIQTRVIQAIGRCTRSLEDYSAVIITGNELADYLADTNRRNYLHPELQAELEFGVEQSIDSTFEDLLENYDIFIENGDDWENVNNDIVTLRHDKEKKPFPAIENLSKCVGLEIDYVTALWSKDYPEALQKAESILGVINDPQLKGYRAHWEYLAGSAAYLAEQDGDIQYAQKAREHYTRAKKAAKNIPWLTSLANYLKQPVSETQKDLEDKLVMNQVEGIESLLESIGKMHDRKLIQLQKEIIEGLESENNFEEAHRLVGEHLGFDSRKVESDASPDPWWQIGNICFVFEDHANADTDILSATKPRQVSTHPNWIRTNVESCKDESVKIIPILISPVTKVKPGAIPHLDNVAFWALNDFKLWVHNALETIAELRTTFNSPGDLVWRAHAASKLVSAGLDIHSIKTKFETSPCSKALEKIS